MNPKSAQGLDTAEAGPSRKYSAAAHIPELLDQPSQDSNVDIKAGVTDCSAGSSCLRKGQVSRGGQEKEIVPVQMA